MPPKVTGFKLISPLPQKPSKKQKSSGWKPVNEEEILAEIRQKCEHLGLPIRVVKPRREDGSSVDPILPPDLTLLNDEELGRLFTEFARMAQWAKIVTSAKVVEASVRKRQGIVTRAKVRLEKSGTVSDKDDKTEMDDRTRTVEFNLLVAEGVGKISYAAYDAYVEGRDAISRELTRRLKLLGNDRLM